MELTSLQTDRKSKRKQSAMPDMVYGRVPPQAKDVEEWVLGACMMQPGIIDTVIEILRPECFYVESNKLIFESMLSLHGKGWQVDIISVVEELKRKDLLDVVGGPYYVTRLTNSVTSTANIEKHCRIILQKFILREMIRISGEIIGKAYEDSTDEFDLLDKAETAIFGITSNFLKKDFVSSGQAVVKVVERVDHLRLNTEDITGVTSGFFSLDRITYGWQDTDLIIIAARPAVGKTALALNFARNAALHPVKPVPVGFFSLEMSTNQLMMRMLAAESELPMEFISRGKLDDRQYTTFMGRGVRKMETAPIYIDDTAAINIMQFRAKARRMVSKYKVGLIVIDYLQLMSGNGEKGNREQEISNISRNLKALAKELNVPIIALSQLSRQVENRTGEKKMPQLSDLRESGAIEQDADMVMFIYRPEYYDVMNNENGESTSGETHIKIAKHRNGSLGTVQLKARLDIQKFEEWQGERVIIDKNWKPVSSFDDAFTKPI